MKPRIKRYVSCLEIDDRRGVVSDIASFFDQFQVKIVRGAVATTEAKTARIILGIEIREKSLKFLLSALEVYAVETHIKRYVLYRGVKSSRWHEYFDKYLRGENFPGEEICKNEVIDHKRLLINCVNNLPATLINHASRSGSVLFEINPSLFEELVAELFASNGFSVELTQRSRDGGKDIIALKYDMGIPSRWIVECKRYRSRKVDVKLVRQLYGIKEAEHYHNAVLVTTSSFTDPAIQFERSVWGLTLADYNALMEWIKGYRFADSGGIYLAEGMGSPIKRPLSRGKTSPGQENRKWGQA